MVRRVASGAIVRRLAPEPGRFAIRLPSGLYRVVARVTAECWEGDSKRVGVRAGAISRVRLRVFNACIL